MSDQLITVPESEWEELRRRVRNARWPQSWPITGWEAGTEPDALRRLAEHWADGFDWRTHERAINALPSYREVIDGVPVSYLRFDAETMNATPIILTHGWPSTILEEVELARSLAYPSEHGAIGATSFTVIVPALPGFPLAAAQQTIPGIPTHELWHGLMSRLGFDRYLAHGGDLGAGVSARLAQAHPETIAGVHILAAADPAERSNLTGEELAYLAQGERWYAEEGGYEHLQRTRPLTVGYALNDSPVGLLAWLLEKYRAWTDHGSRLSGIPNDLILTQASLYWFTGAITASFRPYWEHKHYPPGPVQVAVPTGLAVFPADLVQPPRSWAARNYNVVHYRQMPRGGHFAAIEEPGLLAEDIRTFASRI